MKNLRSRFLTTLFAAFILAASLTAALPSPATAAGNISMDFKSVDIHVLIKFISELTGRNFIVDRRVNGRVTVYSPTKISVDEAYKVFESVLTVNNFTVVPSGSAWKIVPISEAIHEDTPTSTSTTIRRDKVDEMVTQVIALKHSSARELAKVLPKIVGKSGLVNVYIPNNTIIITAPYASIKQALKLVNEVDKAQHAPTLRTFKMEHGNAKLVAQGIEKIMTAKAKELEKIGQQALAFIHFDERTNTVIAYADPDSLVSIEEIVDSLDIPTPKGKGDIHYIALENAKAEDVATVLNTLIERQGQTKEEKVLSRDVKVVADKATNSLIITAQPDEFITLQRTIAKLDVLRRQVFIEALILEAASDASFNFGINWGAGGEFAEDAYLFGGTNTGGSSVTLNSASGIASLPSGASIGMVMDNVFSLGGNSYGIQSIANAVKGDNNFRILSTPQLLTLDNEEAKVDVVDNIPFVKATTTANTSEFTTQSIDYKDVGVKLQITPHIGSRDTLRLEVQQEVSRLVNSFVQVAEGENVIAPTTKRRQIETTILMKNGETAVIAGLISEDDTVNNNKVPGLGDVPVLGWLFKQKKTENKRTNLFVFITPRIINTFDESKELAVKKRRQLQRTHVGEDGSALPMTTQARAPRAALID